MNLTDIAFCKPDKAEEHLSISFDFEQKFLNSYYEIFQNQFHELPSVTQPLLREEFIPKTNDKNFIDKFNDSKFTTGIDLPILLRKKNKIETECVFIVGEDPLRSYNDNINGEIILSTPYAPQYKKYREGYGKLYWRFSLYLLENYAVHYTDVTKIWVCEKNKRKLKIPKDLAQHFVETLEKEMNDYTPNLIITFGKPAEEAAKTIIAEKDLLSFPHPASSSFRKKRWTKRYNSSVATDEEVLRIMKSEFEKNTGTNLSA